MIDKLFFTSITIVFLGLFATKVSSTISKNPPDWVCAAIVIPTCCAGILSVVLLFIEIWL